MGVILFALITSVLYFRSDTFYRLFGYGQPVQKSSVHTLTSGERTSPGQSINLYYVSTNDLLGREVADNTQKAMDYAKIHYKVIKPEAIGSIKADPYNGIILSGENQALFPRTALENFVKGGGRLIAANRFYVTKDWFSLFGMTAVNGFTDVTGFHFNKTLFPGYPNIPASSRLFNHSSLAVKLNPDTTEPLVTAENLPVLWTNRFGRGKVLFWNTSALNDKTSRGLFDQALGKVFPAFVSGQLGAQTMYIDDFPAPAPDTTTDKITGYPITVRNFYQNVWWPAMKKIAADNHIKFTTVAIGIYQKIMGPPFPDLSNSDRNFYIYFGWENLSMGGELGIHGFNHQPLLLAGDPTDKTLGYSSWHNESDMVQSLVQLQKLVHQYFPENQINVYVPPSDMLNATGLDAISKAAPTVKTVASSYLGSTSEGSYVTEFGYDRQHPNIFLYPRVTSGYSLSVDDWFSLADAVANFGVVSHFVHPDDVLDPQRSGNQKWSQLSREYDGIITKVRTSYPQITSVTQSEATRMMKDYFKGDIITTYENHAIHIAFKGIPAQSSVIVHVEEGKKLDVGRFSFGRVIKLGSQLYDVELSKPQATLPIREG